MEADYQIDCESAEYYRLQGMAILLVFIVPLGVPAVLLAIVRTDFNGALARSPEKFFGVTTAERKGDQFFDRYEFLQAGYKSVFFYWAVWELIFVLSVTANLIFFQAGSATQVRESGPHGSISLISLYYEYYEYYGY